MARFEAARDLDKQVLVATGDDRYRVGTLIAAEGRATAPRVTGAYAGGMGARRFGGGQVAVVDTDPESGYKEYGTVDTPAHAELTNAARRYGRYSGR